ncbi:MAG: choice-of-anchor Q domain-containing protein [Polyangiaceae bacterium]
MRGGSFAIGLLLASCTNDYDLLRPAEDASSSSAGGATGTGGGGGASTSTSTSTGGGGVGAAGGGGECPAAGDEDCSNLLDDDADGAMDCLDDACQGCAACNGAIFVAPGADGDGSFTSPTGDLAGALRGCGQVYLFGGTYAAAVVVPPDCKLVGSGAEKTKLDATALGTSVVSVPDGGAGAVVAHLTISGGDADDGGGIRLEDGALLVVGAVIADNSATRGGGIFAADSASLNVVRAKILNNIANDRGGGAYVAAGGQWTHVEVTSNQSQTGGGLDLDGASVTMLDVLLGANTATNGGGLHIDGGSLDVDRLRVSDNVGSNTGGGLLLENAAVLVQNGLLVRNTASADGGAIWAGAGDITLQHVTMSRNDSAGNAAIRCPGPTVKMRNSIVGFNDGGQAVNPGCDVHYSNYSGGSADQNNFSGDPLFVDSAADWHLQSGSPCRDQGDPAVGLAVDLDGDPRDAMPDMGAFEVQ